MKTTEPSLRALGSPGSCHLTGQWRGRCPPEHTSPALPAPGLLHDPGALPARGGAAALSDAAQSRLLLPRARGGAARASHRSPSGSASRPTQMPPSLRRRNTGKGSSRVSSSDFIFTEFILKVANRGYGFRLFHANHHSDLAHVPVLRLRPQRGLLFEKGTGHTRVGVEFPSGMLVVLGLCQPGNLGLKAKLAAGRTLAGDGNAARILRLQANGVPGGVPLARGRLHP